jgi:hypothetical protein
MIWLEPDPRTVYFITGLKWGGGKEETTLPASMRIFIDNQMRLCFADE